MSIVTVPSQPRGWKSLPTEFRSFRPGDGAERIARTGEGLQGMGNWQSNVTDWINAGGALTLEILAAQNPGVRVSRTPDGRIEVYNTAGQKALLPGNYGFDANTGTFYPQPAAQGNVPLPGGGQTSFKLDSTTMIMIAVVGLLGIMALKK